MQYGNVIITYSAHLSKQQQLRFQEVEIFAHTVLNIRHNNAPLNMHMLLTHAAAFSHTTIFQQLENIMRWCKLNSYRPYV